jgi:hypothetical protein
VLSGGGGGGGEAKNLDKPLYTPKRNSLMKSQINWLIVIVIKRNTLREKLTSQVIPYSQTTQTQP